MRDIQVLLKQAEDLLHSRFAEIESVSITNQRRVLEAFRSERVSDFHLHGSSGYGYGDSGREVIENLYSRVFGGKSALVRGQFASGTHALACALFGILRPGDELVIATGEPYDTLHQVIGLGQPGKSSLAAWGITHRVVPLHEEGSVDLKALREALSPRTRVVHVQRSRGYQWRRALQLSDIAKVLEVVKGYDKSISVIVDNCYGEFVGVEEPCHVGADLAIGSLIKNPGGGMALSGGYIVGATDLVELAAERLYAPGIGDKVGASTTFNRGFLQGLFLAPAVVSAALKGAVLLAQACELLGRETSPRALEPRGDIIQAIRMPSKEAIIRFCQGIQASSPIDSHVLPEPGDLPGYDSAIIMAAGTFVLGASSELSADAPIREPYTVYVQGGLTYQHVRVALERALEALI